LHQAMPRKAERDVEIFEPTDPGPEDRIVVERVLVVMPGPGAFDLQRLERRATDTTSNTTGG
jgi:hypothetical protein